MINVIFFGTEAFSIPILEYLSKKTNLVCVVTKEDKPKGRGKKTQPNIVKDFANSIGINKILTPSNLKDKDFLNEIANLKPDLLVTASYGKILPKDLLTIPKYASINIHPSLLPLYPGAEPIFWQIMRGEKESGVTIFEMNSKIDSGEIILQESIQIDKADNYEDVLKKLTELSVKLLDKLLNLIEESKPLPKVKQQNESKVFYARKITQEDEKIDWNKPSQEIINKIRAFSPKIGAYTLFKGKRVKIYKAKIVENIEDNLKPGAITIKGIDIVVKTADSFVSIDSLKPEGKNIISAAEFINGYLKKIDEAKFE
ncbi:MAG: methionyl-tRNA formyltransferase [Caldisericia bacterium]|nr:methionyl-tRNA formyltransferase [Caldisericia bacterium]